VATATKNTGLKRRDSAGRSERPKRRPPAARVLQRIDVDYGVWIVVGSLLLMFVSVGVGYYGLAVFADAFDELGWSSTIIGLATGTFFALGGVTSWAVGPYVDRHGPLVVMFVGISLLGGGAMFVGSVSQEWQLFVLYGLMAVGFGGAASVGVHSMLSRWFVTRRARAMSVVFAGVSLGGVILTPLAAFVLDRSGLATTGVFLGVLVLGVGLPVVGLVLAWDPADLGLRPDYGKPLAVDNANLDEAIQARVWTRSEAMRTVPFWAIVISFVLILVAQTGFVIQQFAFLTDRFEDRQAASFTLSVTAMGSILARLVVGRFADNIDKRLFSVVLFVVQATAVVAIALTDNVVASWVLVLIIGFTIGNVYMMQTLLLTEIFGVVSLGTVMGSVALATQTASGFGPFAVGWLRDVTGGFTTPFLVTAGMSYLAAIVVLFARPVPPQPTD
jgi:MFS family permease